MVVIVVVIVVTGATALNEGMIFSDKWITI